jgi:integrase
MGRRRGPRKKANGGPNWYACLTVPKDLRAKAGKTELWRSLGTANHSEATKRYGTAIEALERELEVLVTEPSLRELVELNRGSVVVWGEPVVRNGKTEYVESLEVDHEFVAESITWRRSDKEVSFPLVLNALKNDETMSLTWEELRSFYAKARATKKGKPLSSAALFEVDKAIAQMRKHAEYPDLLTTKCCRAIYKYFIEESGLKPKTIMSRLGMAKTMIKTGIKHEALKLQSNPWDPVDFIVQDRPEDSYRSFTNAEVQELFSLTNHPEAWYVLFGTALRIGELWSRDHSHLDGQMLRIVPTARQGNRLKTETSIRRVPLNDKAAYYFKSFFPYEKSKDSLQRYLRLELRQLGSWNEKLVIHSTRHTWKTWSRRVGMPIDVSDELDGHKKKITSDVSDGYGIYPDELLIEQNQKVWNYLDTLLA